MADRPTPQPGVLSIANYVPGRAKAAPGVEAIKLSANESPLGASPKAMAAFQAAADKLAIYPEGSSRELREAIGDVQGLDPERIIVGCGSDEILHLLAQIYLGDGDEAIMTRHGFLVYPIVTKGAGATPIIVPSPDFTASVDNILAAVTGKTKIVFLDNPNNPTGTYLSGLELRRLHEGLRPDILLIIDSAYAEYADAADYETGVDLVHENENVVMVRTFSKMGLAALRVGWGYAHPHIVDAYNRLRGPFNINLPAQAAAAAAMRDVEFTSELQAHNSKWRTWLTGQLSSNRLQVLPSQGNFILVLFPQEKGFTAEEADRELLAHGLVTRQVAAYGLPQALRISIGSQDAMKKAAEVLAAFMAGERNV